MINSRKYIQEKSKGGYFLLNIMKFSDIMAIASSKSWSLPGKLRYRAMELSFVLLRKLYGIEPINTFSIIKKALSNRFFKKPTMSINNSMC